jgi:hypothetical protein
MTASTDYDRASSMLRTVGRTHGDESQDGDNAKGDQHGELLPINLPKGKSYPWSRLSQCTKSFRLT